MNIVRQTKWALLELFPDQKENEAVAEETAWNNARAAEAAAKAEAEAKEKEAAEAAAAKAAEEGKDSETVLDKIEADMASIDLVEKVKTDSAPGESEDEEPAASYDPETDDLPISEVPEGDRPDGVFVVDYTTRGVHLDVQCSRDQVIDTAKKMLEAGFTLESIAGVDWIKEEQMEVVYDYSRTDGQFCRVAVRLSMPRSEPAVPSISSVYPGANWHERETHEFFGIKFEGHPYLVPLLLPEDADFHPLLKDFTP